jgi:serine/threonine-protein kinase
MSEIPTRLSTALADRYTIERELGAGGMATVYLAHDLKHNRKVAVKVLRPELVAVVGAERFLQEIEVTANLHHPHIVQLHDSGEADGDLYYVMPLVEGESLREKLNRENQLSIENALAITRAVAEALDYAHRRNVIHRDIKPENILLQEGTPLVADFGIALTVSRAAGDRITETGLSLGTPSYMSPEQATGDRELDARSDVYALGSVLYEMLAGDPPFSGSNMQAVIAKILVEQPVGLRTIRNTVPAHIAAAVDRALAKVPADRFATAGQFAEALSAHDVALAAPSAGRERLRLLALAGVVGLIGAGSYALLRANRSAGEPSGLRASFDQLTAEPGVEWFPSLSPDGRWIVYSGEGSGNRDIYLKSVGGQNQINLTDDSPAADDQPAFSPDGEQIAFRSSRAGGGIFVMGRTGEAVKRVTNMGFKPAWSPDGTQLAFATENVELNPQNSQGLSQLWVVEVNTGEQRQLSVADGVLPSWSPGGHRVAYTQRLGQPAQGDIWTIPAEGPTGAPNGRRTGNTCISGAIAVAA